MHSRLPVGLTRPQNDGREIRVVHGIRKVLGLEAKAMMLLIKNTEDASQSAIQEVARVKLNTRFRCQEFHDPACLWFGHARGEGQSRRLSAIVSLR
jgi:hypothetical protein